MSTYILVRYNNPTHRLFSVTSPFVDVAEPSGGSGVWWISSNEAGAHEFEIEASVQEIEITLRFTLTHGAHRYAWIFRDRYRRQGTGWTPIREAPRSLDSDRPQGAQGQHQRTRLSSLERRALWRTVANPDAGARRVQSVIPVVDVDLSLIDATELVQDIYHGHRHRLDDGMMAGCALRFYQYTGTGGGESCSVVAVLVAPPLRRGAARERIDTLTFFGPVHEEDGYADVVGVYLGQLNRYLRLYPHARDSARFFGLCQYPRGLYQDAAHTIEAIPSTTAYPECRFAYQLAQSERAVVMIMPVANRGDYSPWSSGALTATNGQRVDALLHSVLKALQSDGHLAGNASSPRVRRGKVGISGFSAGGATALNAFGENRANVSDLFLFDPNDFADGGSNQSAVLAWVQTAERRLRLIGGMHRAELVAFARRAIHAITGQSESSAVDASHDRRPDPLSSDPSVLVLPTRDEFWSASPDYAAAHATAHDPLLVEEGSSDTGVVSAVTRIYIVPGTARGSGGLELRGELPSGGHTTTVNVRPFTRPEISLTLYESWWRMNIHNALEQRHETERQAQAQRHQQESDALAQQTPAPSRRATAALQRRHRREDREMNARHQRDTRERLGNTSNSWPFWSQAHIQSQDDFDTRLHRARTPFRSGGIAPPYGGRHQWCVYGGQGTSTTYDSTFRGYLQICLETSSFAR